MVIFAVAYSGTVYYENLTCKRKALRMVNVSLYFPTLIWFAYSYMSMKKVLRNFHYVQLEQHSAWFSGLFWSIFFSQLIRIVGDWFVFYNPQIWVH
jgi:hypothetical protein